MFYGYVKHPELEHNTAFFEYASLSEEDLTLFNSFNPKNEQSLEQVTKVSGRDQNASFCFNEKDHIKFDPTKVPTCFMNLTFAEP